MTFYVFSYNRGRFLENCVNSIRTLAPSCRVVVVDDHSSDAETCAFLDTLRGTSEVLRPPPAAAGRHGGLYNNMQLALEHAAAEPVIFIQDDMQVVRPLGESDLAEICGFFNQFPRCAFLHPCFLKGARRKREHRITKQSGKTRFYFRDYPEKANYRGIYFTDVCVAHVPRLRAAGWQFQQGEIANAAQAQQLFEKMGFMADPFMMYLPDVPVFRGKKQTRSARWAERITGTAPKAFAPLNPEESTSLKSRSPQVLPFAEDFLHCPGHKVRKPFAYSSTHAVPWLHLTHKIELLLHRRRK